MLRIPRLCANAPLLYLGAAGAEARAMAAQIADANDCAKNSDASAVLTGLRSALFRFRPAPLSFSKNAFGGEGNDAYVNPMF